MTADAGRSAEEINLTYPIAIPKSTVFGFLTALLLYGAVTQISRFGGDERLHSLSFDEKVSCRGTFTPNYEAGYSFEFRCEKSIPFSELDSALKHISDIEVRVAHQGILVEVENHSDIPILGYSRDTINRRLAYLTPVVRMDFDWSISFVTDDADKLKACSPTIVIRPNLDFQTSGLISGAILFVMTGFTGGLFIRALCSG